MDDYESLSHTAWDCKYHVVFIPKCRRKTLYGQLRPHLGEVFKRLAMQKESWSEEGASTASTQQSGRSPPFRVPTGTGCRQSQSCEETQGDIAIADNPSLRHAPLQLAPFHRINPPMGGCSAFQLAEPPAASPAPSVPISR